MKKFILFLFFVIINGSVVLAQNTQIVNGAYNPNRISNNATGISVAPSVNINNDAAFVETAVELEISTDNTFNPATVAVRITQSVTNTSIQYVVIVPSSTSLEYSTVYFARVRSFVGASPSPWSTIVTFTTKAPTIVVQSPTNGAVLTNINQTFESSSGGSINRFFWEIERTDATTPTQSPFSLTTTTRFAYFNNYLLAGKAYRVRVTGTSTTNPTINVTSAWVSFSIANVIVLANSYVTFIDNISTNQASVTVANKFQYTLQGLGVARANKYNWQIDDDINFGSINLSFSSTGITTTLITTQLESGKDYYIRVEAENTNNPGEKSNLATSTKKLFRNSLHPTTLYTPTGTITRGSFKIWSLFVQNASDVVFQVDDNSNFSSPHSNPMNLGYGGNAGGGNSNYSGIAGNVFKSNLNWYYNSTTGAGGYSPNGGVLAAKVFDYVAGLLNGTYYVRVRAINPARGHTGYWSTVGTINVSIPNAPNTFIKNIANNATSISNNPTLTINDDSNFWETKYDVQISKDNFSTLTFNETKLGLIYSPKNLEYNTTYKARVRSYIKNNNNVITAQAWSTITFTTKSASARIASIDESQASENKLHPNTISPNPFSTTTRITVGLEHENVTLIVTDMMGRVIYQVPATEGQTLELGEHWQKGIYIVQVIDVNKQELAKTFKVIKQ